MAIGAQVSDRDGTNDLAGKIDFLRITVGTDRGWTSAFTPPTLADIGFQYSAESTAALSASGLSSAVCALEREYVGSSEYVRRNQCRVSLHADGIRSSFFGRVLHPWLAQATMSQGLRWAIASHPRATFRQHHKRYCGERYGEERKT